MSRVRSLLLIQSSNFNYKIIVLIICKKNTEEKTYTKNDEWSYINFIHYISGDVKKVVVMSGMYDKVGDPPPQKKISSCGTTTPFFATKSPDMKNNLSVQKI